MRMQPTIKRDGTPVMTYTTDCCGATHYDFPGVERFCYSCGRSVEQAPIETERNLDHLRYQAVSRYVS